MTFRITVAPAALALLFAVACTFAHPGFAAESKPAAGGSGLDTLGDQAKTAEALFAVLDENGDGRIDRAEWQTRKMAIFYTRDVDNDFQVSRDEMPRLTRSRFDETDLNKDGFLSGYEFNQAPLSRFDDADEDGDGNITIGEFRGYMAKIGNAG